MNHQHPAGRAESPSHGSESPSGPLVPSEALNGPHADAQAIASCPGYETVPNPCRCPCYGCKHHCGAHNPVDRPASSAQSTPERPAPRSATDGPAPTPPEPHTGAQPPVPAVLHAALMRAGLTTQEARDEAARLTAEVHATAPPVCICGHPAQQHHEDACLVCDCGDYLEPEAAREEIARLTQAAAPCADQTALRARIAQAVRHYPGCTPLTDGACYRIADAVLAVLPAPADRAAIYRGLAAWYERGVAEAIPGERPDWYEALADVARGLRRLAAEAPRPEGEAPEGAIDLADGPVRCPLCPHTVTLHTPNGARAHFTAVHPEQRLVGRGPWPLLGAPPAPEQAAMTAPADRAAIYNPALRVVLADAAEAQPADDFAEVRARRPEHGTRTETYPECRCPATRPDDTTGAPR